MATFSELSFENKFDDGIVGRTMAPRPLTDQKTTEEKDIIY